jgi:hypothetical protein
MPSDFQERHQDYVIDQTLDARLHDVAPGQLVSGIELHLETDAPFLLRGRAYRVQYDTLASQTQVGIQNLALRFAGPDLNFFSDILVPQNLEMPYGGQSGAWKPVSPQVLYPAGSVLTVDILNTGPTHLNNLVLYWRGVKLYTPGQNPAYTYPKKMKAIPFSYPIAPITTGNPFGMIQNLLATEQRLRQPFNCLNDADFVLRYGQAGRFFAPFGLEVFMTLRDENEKAFSNLPVHVEVLFGPSQGNYQTGGATIPAIGTGNALPSVFYPEIYIPASHQLWYDIIRADGGFAGSATIPNYPVTLTGSKVYPQ